MTGGGSAPEDPATLRALAEQCRRLARGVSARDVAAALEEMAADYDRKAAACEPRPEPSPNDG